MAAGPLVPSVLDRENPSNRLPSSSSLVWSSSAWFDGRAASASASSQPASGGHSAEPIVSLTGHRGGAFVRAMGAP